MVLPRRMCILILCLTAACLTPGVFGYGQPAEGSAKRTKASPLTSQLHAAYRHGQLFLRWKESPHNTENLRVYISSTPITAQSLSQAQLLSDQIEPHSANDWYDDPKACARATGPVHGWIIQPGGDPLDPRGGLFVHTVSKKDPARAYLAVLGAQESTEQLTIGVNSLADPVAIQPGEMQAIWQLQNTPRSAKGKPLVIFLHSHQGRPKGELTHLFFGDKTMGWREGLPFKFKVTVGEDAVLMEPYDRVWINRKMSEAEAKANNGTYDTQFKNIESWWYGTNDKINHPDSIAAGTPTNYTERWLLWAMHWVHQNYGTDPQRVYAFGSSMGTGVLRLVLRNPDRFASVDLLVPILDPFGEGNIGNRMHSRVGAAQSICSDGIPLKDRLNTLRAVKATTTDLPPMVLRIGREDKSVFWGKKPLFVRTAQQHKQALFVGWDNGTHATAMRKPHTGFPNWFDFAWHINHFARNRSYPVFTGFSADDHLGSGDPHTGDTTGFINRGLDWTILEDSDTAYRIKITASQPPGAYPVLVDVTPRHYQQFPTHKIAQVSAHNLLTNGQVVEKKQLMVDDEGLLTYPKFAITSASGNILWLSKQKDR